MEITDETHDPDDVEGLQDETRRHNDRLAMETGAEIERRRIRKAFKKRPTVPDEQEFRDAITAEGPVGARDAQADMEDEIARVEALDVLEGLRSLQQGDPINWRIYRVGASESELNGFLDTWSTSQLTQERLRDKFGGGTYRIRGTYSNGQFAGGRTVRVAGDAQRKETSMTSSGGSAFNMSEFLAQQAARDAQLRKEQDERLSREKREKDDADDRRRKERNDLLAIVMPAVSAIGAAIAGAFGGRQDNTAALIAAVKGPDPLVLLTQLQTLQKQNQPDVLTKILPMLIDMAGSKASGGDTGWLDVIKEFAKGAGPAVGGLIEAQLKATQAAQQPTMEVVSSPAPPLTRPLNPMLPAGSATGAPGFQPEPNGTSGSIVVPDSVRRRERRSATALDPSIAGSPMRPAAGNLGQPARTAGNSSPSNGSGEMNLMSLMPHLPWLRDVLTRMLQGAARGKSPQVYAALFLEEVPDEVSGETVLELLGAPDWFANICKVVPQWNDSRVYPWLELARRDILSTVQQSMGAPPTAAHDASQSRVTQAAPTGAPSLQGAPSPRRNTDEIDRPTKLPSLTGD